MDEKVNGMNADLVEKIKNLIACARKIEIGHTPDHQGWPVPIIKGNYELLRAATEAEQAMTAHENTGARAAVVQR